jgi:hypothetical protein
MIFVRNLIALPQLAGATSQGVGVTANALIRPPGVQSVALRHCAVIMVAGTGPFTTG